MSSKKIKYVTYKGGWRLRECILPITFSNLALLDVAELKEVCRPVVLVVEIPGHAQLHVVLHLWVVLHSHEVEVPRGVIRNLVGTKASK